MASEARAIDVADVGDLGTLVEEIRRSGTPRILRHDGEDVAVLVPVSNAERRHPNVAHLRCPTAEEIQCSRAGIKAAAGSWKDVDTEGLRRELRRQRNVITR